MDWKIISNSFLLIFSLLTLILSHISKRWGEVVAPIFFLSTQRIFSMKAVIEPLPFVPTIWIAGIFLQGSSRSPRAFLSRDNPNWIFSLSNLGDSESKFSMFTFIKIDIFYSSLKIKSNFFRSILISFFEIINGGTNLTTFPPAGTRSKPLSKAFNVIVFASVKASLITRPCINPIPLLPLIILGNLAEILLRPSFNWAPLSRTFLRILRLFISSKTVIAALQANGLPPKVLAWSPGEKMFAFFCTNRAPIACPPPNPFANVNPSG